MDDPTYLPAGAWGGVLTGFTSSAAGRANTSLFQASWGHPGERRHAVETRPERHELKLMLGVLPRRSPPADVAAGTSLMLRRFFPSWCRHRLRRCILSPV